MPGGWRLLPIAQYPALFSLLGTNYGGDGRATFALPNLRSAAHDDILYLVCIVGVFP